METSCHIDQTTAVINEMPEEAVRELLILAEAAPIELCSPPQSGLVMMHVLDAFGSEFLLGEVLVTSAEVQLNGQRSFAIVSGDAADRARARACATALLQGDDQRLRVQVQKLLEREQQQLQVQRCREEQLIAATKVNFELMAGN